MTARGNDRGLGSSVQLKRRQRGAWAGATPLTLLALAMGSTAAEAYPGMIRHEYATCAQCHVDPSGGSTLTTYGRAQSEVLLRTPFGERPEDWEPSSASGFLFGVPLPDELLLSGSLRGAIVANPAREGFAVRMFPMQADVTAAVVSGRLRVAGSLGYAGGSAARRAAVIDSPNARLISRQHWVGVTLGGDEQGMLRAGRLNLPFGLRNTEHTSWVRSATRTDSNDQQQHGVSLFWATERLRLELMGIVGNLQVSPWVHRDLGYSGYLEIAALPRFTIGAASQVTHSMLDLVTQRPTFRQAHGLFARLAPHHALLLMTEWDLVITSPKGQGVAVELVGLLQVDVEPIQGLHLIGTFENRCDGRPGPGCSVGAWGTVAWFFAPHTDVRVDLMQRWSGQADGFSPSTQLIAQLHLFL